MTSEYPASRLWLLPGEGLIVFVLPGMIVHAHDEYNCIRISSGSRGEGNGFNKKMACAFSPAHSSELPPYKRCGGNSMTMDAVFPKCFFKGLRTIPLIQINATQNVVYVRSMWRAMMLACGVAVSGVEHFASLPLF